MMRSSCYYLLSIVTLVHFLSPPARGDYTLRTQVHSYDNPTNRCFRCSSSRARGCCDGFQVGVECNGETRCDNEFFTCARPLGTPRETLSSLLDIVDGSSPAEDRARALQCVQPQTAIKSDTNSDGGFIDFTGPTFLGLLNPIEFQIDADEWEGIQFYLDVLDSDPGFNDRDDVVESFAVDIGTGNVAAGRGMTEVLSFNGVFQAANIELSFEVVCQPGFVGETCVPRQICSTEPCSNNGTCLQSASGFTCACQGDFTGETCETRINDCQDVDCNNGTCVDGVQSFTCWCEEGFAGESCEQMNLTTTTITTATTISDAITTSTGGTITTGNVITTGGTITTDNVITTGGTIATDDVITTDDVMTTNDNTTDAATSSSIDVSRVVVPLISVVIAIIALAAVAVILLWKKIKPSSFQGKTEDVDEPGPTLDNPVYDVGGQYVADEREVDNPIYGLQDEDIDRTYDMPMT